jgi:hypothetical protein
MVSLTGLTLLSNPSKVTFTHREEDGFIAQNDTTRIKVSGEDFSYFGGRPKATSGTITGLKYYSYDADLDSFVLRYKLTDARLKLYDAATTSDLAALTKEVFAKKDVLVGSSGDDTLSGFGKKDKLRGKDGNDFLHGDGGKDILDGGAGADYLDGGKGKDTFVFKSDPATGTDTVLAFQKGEKIQLGHKVFDGLEKGKLGDGQFVSGPAALDADDHVIYDPGTGYLRYDADGSGLQPAVLIAVLPKNIGHLDAGNFLVI